MANTKFFAQHNGQTFTRSTARVYTHTVVAKPRQTYKAARSSAEDRKQYDQKYMAYLQAASRPDYQYASVVTDAERAKYAADLARGLDALNAEAAAKAVTRVEELNAEGFFDAFQNHGWCGRADLAQKLADKLRGEGYREVTILVAQVK